MASLDGELTLLKFWAPWCAPCKSMAPIIKEVLQNFATIKLVDINIDEDPSMAVRYKVRSIPTIILLNDDQQVDRLIGSAPADKVKEFLSSHI